MKLVFFSYSYPTSRTEGWKAPELRVLQRVFDEIVVAPFIDGGHDVATDFPPGIRVLPPLFGRDGWGFSRARIPQMLGTRLAKHLGTFDFGPARRAKGGLKRWLMSRVRVEAMLRSPTFKLYVLPELDGSCLYFYWGADYAEILPYLTKRQRMASLVRFHGYDLYWERADGYLPAQRAIIESAAVAAPISQHGASYLRGKYPDQAAKIQCHRLGTLPAGPCRPSDDGIVRIVSCAYVRPLKRLHLIIPGLHQLDRPAEWTHIGDGDDLDELREAARTLPPHVRCNFIGRLEPADIGPYYEANPFDVFVNVSESEGISIAIMEAMAAGIPPVATDVGGTRELVDDSVGRLLAPDFTPIDLARAVERVVDGGAHAALRERCRARIAEDFNLIANSERMGQTLQRLASIASARR